jgi:hypothetical protein
MTLQDYIQKAEVLKKEHPEKYLEFLKELQKTVTQLDTELETLRTSTQAN